jgi:hypothetical protein
MGCHPSHGMPSNSMREGAQKQHARRVIIAQRVILPSFIAFNVFYGAASIMPRRPPLFSTSCTESRDNP